jgi:acetyl-CoA C-acetyltransferase
MDKEIVIVNGARTPFGSFGGSLRDISATDLGVIAAQGALGRAGVAAAQVDQVIFGNVIQSGRDAIYLARHIALKAGCPLDTPSLTLNRLCGSGFQAVVSAAEQILLGEAELVLAGGTENMSETPYVVRAARWGARLGHGEFEDTLWMALNDGYANMGMAITAENLAAKYGVHRKAADDYAYTSQMRTAAAWEAGRLAEEVVPVPLQTKRGPAEFLRDEHPKPTTTVEGLAALKPLFKEDGVVTAGNASGISDGAGALVVASAARAQALGLRPIGRLVAWGIAGVDPTIMGIGPAPAARKALGKAGLRLEQMDLVEVNEAFAAQYLAVEAELGLDRERTNVNGGAVAIGHPVGASGARLTLTILLELRRRRARYGLASACIGGGQGIAVILEAIH